VWILFFQGALNREISEIREQEETEHCNRSIFVLSRTDGFR
jgi:hypothetical protein